MRSTLTVVPALVLAALTSPGSASAQTPPAATEPPLAVTEPGTEIVVTASRGALLGTAATASDGVVTKRELDLRPVYRIGQLLESTPGLIVTVHSGEGKANQYLIRGFNLDHGTDIAIFADAMPVNRPTNAHGQGYADLNFLMPELIAGTSYTKGPYHASVGDFGAVASTRARLVNELPNQMAVSIGTVGDENVFASGTMHFGSDDRLIAAADYGHLDGPWTHPDDFRKINAALRYSHGTETDGFSLTALYYRSHGNLTTDQPARAISRGLIDRFGTLDPSDGSRSTRFSLSGNYSTMGSTWELTAGAYYINSQMTLWNDFTHFLDDPVNGDQEEQYETRAVWGGALAYKRRFSIGSVATETVFGVQARYDDAEVQRRHTADRRPLDHCSVPQSPLADGTYVAALQVPAPGGACQSDHVHLLDLGFYAETTVHWTPWLRTVLGAREEYYHATAHSFVTGVDGAADESLFQPKGSVILGPWRKTELYLTAGRGFHSDDVRGVFGSTTLGIPAAAGKTPLLARATGFEAGARTSIIPRLDLELVAFQQDFASEIAYNQDVGQDQASAPSRRRGVELTAKYRPWRWLELNGDVTASKARYRGDYAAFGFAQPYIANAPGSTASAGVLIDGLGRWSGGAQLRRLGAFAIDDGKREPRDPGFTEVNLDVNYQLSERLTLGWGIYNLTNTHANAGAYYYVSRLRGEPVSGIADYQNHPLEPISARLSAKLAF